LTGSPFFLFLLELVAESDFFWAFNFFSSPVVLRPPRKTTPHCPSQRRLKPPHNLVAFTCPYYWHPFAFGRNLFPLLVLAALSNEIFVGAPVFFDAFVSINFHFADAHRSLFVKILI